MHNFESKPVQDEIRGQLDALYLAVKDFSPSRLDFEVFKQQTAVLTAILAAMLEIEKWLKTLNTKN